MTPPIPTPSLGAPPPVRPSGTRVAVAYGWRRARSDVLRPSLGLAVLLALLFGWAGTNLEILQFEARPEHARGLGLSTAEALGLLWVLASRLRGADLNGSAGWGDALRASALGGTGFVASESLASAAAAWGAALISAMLMLVLNSYAPPGPLELAGWAVAVFFELAVVAAWLALAATWLGRLPGLAVAVAVVALGRTGVGGMATGLWPSAAPIPPEGPVLALLAGGAATFGGLTALATAGRGTGRASD